MDYESFLSHRLGLKEVVLLREELLSSTEDFQKVFNLIFRPHTDLVAWQAAWVCEKISSLHSDIFTNSDYGRLIDFALKNTHNGAQRLCLSMLLHLPLRLPAPVAFINLCFEQMVSPKQPAAVQVLSMKLLYKISQATPDFAYELLATLENADETNYTPAFRAAKKNLLKKLKISIKKSY